MLPTLPFSAFTIVWRSMLNTEGRFALPAVTPAMTPLASIVFLVGLGHSWGVYALAAGTVTGSAMEAGLLAFRRNPPAFPSPPRRRGAGGRPGPAPLPYPPARAGSVPL